MVALSKVRDDNPTLRVDSTYFSSVGLEVDRLLRARSHSTIADASTSVLSFGAYALTNQVEYQDEGIPFLRCADIKGGFISFADALHINEVAHSLLHKSEITPETVLLTMSGSVGEAAVALPKWTYPINSNQDIAKIRTRGLDPYYLSAFLGSGYGQAQIDRLPVGSVQQHIFLSMIERLLVARLDEQLEAIVGHLVRCAYRVREEGGRALTQAETTLLDALGLSDWSPPKPLTYTRSAAAVADAGRLDAEFAAPNVQSLLTRLASSGRTIADVAAVRREKFRPASRGTFDYIEIGNLDGFGRCTSDPIEMAYAPSRATWHVRSGDVLTSSVRPIRRLSAIVSDAQDGDVCSSGFVVLRPTAISAESLLTYLRLPQVCELLHLFATASMYPAVAEKDLLALPLPTIDSDTDAAVVTAVRRSREMLARSEHLLEAAKRAVEIAIEESEAAALTFIAEQEEANAATA